MFKFSFGLKEYVCWKYKEIFTWIFSKPQFLNLSRKNIYQYLLNNLYSIICMIIIIISYKIKKSISNNPLLFAFIKRTCGTLIKNDKSFSTQYFHKYIRSTNHLLIKCSPFAHARTFIVCKQSLLKINIFQFEKRERNVYGKARKAWLSFG